MLRRELEVYLYLSKSSSHIMDCFNWYYGLTMENKKCLYKKGPIEES